MKKKIFALLLAAVMVMSLAACGGNDSGNTADPAPSADPAAPAENNEPAGETYKVGICQLAPHPALDAATEGFTDALNEKLPGQVKIDPQNAAGDTPTCGTIINGFVSSGVDLIMANAKIGRAHV